MNDSIKISKESETWHNMISADGTVKYDFMMSLQNIAIVKIVSTLWMNVETQKRIACVLRGNRHFVDEREWKHIENSILEKISNLRLPDIIFQPMKDVVKYLGEPIIRWFSYHNMYIFFNRDYSAADFINNIIYTARGTIDYEQTAKRILLYQSIFLDDKTKYILACNYCFEAEIKVLTPKVKTMFRYANCDWEPMVYFWREQNAGDSICQNNNASLNERVIRCLIKTDDKIYFRSWNDVPIRFVWNKLSEEEKNRNITSLVKNIKNEECLFSLVSNVCYDLQQKIFNECHTQVLRSFLNNWLWGKYFIPTIFILKKSLEFSNPGKYWMLIKNIYILCIKNGGINKSMHDKCKSIFKRLWCESSSQFKDFIIKYNQMFSLEWFLATELSWKRDADIAELMFNDLNAQQKKNIAFGKYGVQLCIDFIIEDSWDLLELFLKYTLSTEIDLRYLKTRLRLVGHEKIVSHLLNSVSGDKVECFVKWAYQSEEERNKFRQRIYTSEQYHFNVRKLFLLHKFDI